MDIMGFMEGMGIIRLGYNETEIDFVSIGKEHR